jgi:signal transduction histidine kinase
MSATIARSGENHGCYEIIVEDVTERRDLEEQLRHAQKKEAIVRLAGGMAHDFNNVLTVVKGYSELLQDRFPEGDRARAQLAEICKAADRAAVLTHRLLSFSRRQVLAPRVLNLNQTLSSMEKMLHRILDDSVELKTVLDPYLGNIKVDPGQVEQVVMNLVMNARDAMPHRGQIVIQTSNLTVSEGHDAVLAPGRYIMLGVTDSGTGMDADTRSRVFEPFFTTKEHGTGLGLSTVYGIARQNGGHTAIRPRRRRLAPGGWRGQLVGTFRRARIGARQALYRVDRLRLSARRVGHRHITPNELRNILLMEKVW